MNYSLEGEHRRQQLAAERQESEAPPKQGIPVETLDQLIHHLEELVTRREEVTTYPTHDAKRPVWHLQRNVQSWWEEADAIHHEALDNLHTLRLACTSLRVTELPAGYCPCIWCEVDPSIVESWINAIHKTTETLKQALDGEQVSNFFIRASMPAVDLARMTDWAPWEALVVMVRALIEGESHDELVVLSEAQVLHLSEMYDDADEGNLTLGELGRIAFRYVRKSEELNNKPLRIENEGVDDSVGLQSRSLDGDEREREGHVEGAWQTLSDDFARLDPNPWAD
jgi:hypothetical protein